MAYQLDDFVYLKVSPMKGTQHFGIKGKLAPRFVGPFRIVGQRGDLAYQLELPSNFSNVHDVFHVSQLRRYFKTPECTVDLQDIDLQPDLSYHEHPVQFLRRLSARPAISQSSSSRCSGHIILTKRPPGSARITSVPNSQCSFSPRSRVEIFL